MVVTEPLTVVTTLLMARPAPKTPSLGSAEPGAGSVAPAVTETPLVVVETGKQRRKSFDTTSTRLSCQIELGTPSRDMQLQN